jgi:CRISPR-associated Cas5-like protein
MRIIISAPFGHFQRPGNPGEPSTYPIIPPTAVEGLVGAVYWHPGQSVQVKSISLLKPIQYTTETVTQFDHQTSKSWLRTYEILISPSYLVDFRLELDSGIDSKSRIGQLTRRLMEGKHYHQPCMGLSDYPAAVELLAEKAPNPTIIDLSLNLGLMPHYWSWLPMSKVAGKKPFARRTTNQLADRPMQRVTGKAVMFNAKLERGTMQIPHYPQRGQEGYAN